MKRIARSAPARMVLIAASVTLAGCAGTPPAPAPAAAQPRPSRAQPTVPEPGAAQTVQSPFVRDVGARESDGIATSASPAQRFGPRAEGARDFLVQPGQVWGHIIEDVRPGDEIVFPAGFHPPQRIVGLNGTRERPILLRSRDNVAAAVGCGEFGWVFERCSHLVIENILFINPRSAAILVDGGPAGAAATAESPGAHVVIRQCTIKSTRQQDGQDAIRISAASDVIVDAIQVEGWGGSAVRIEDSSRVLVRGLVAIPRTPAASDFGVRIGGASSRIVITNAAFNRGTGTCIEIGTPGAGSPVVRDVTIERSIFDASRVALSLANAKGVLFNRCTVIDASESIWAIDQSAGTVEDVRVDRMLAAWEPGTLRRFSTHPEGANPAGIVIGDVLVHSAELPLGWEAVGRPFGTQSGRLTEDVDPRLDPQSRRPRNPLAQAYGVFVPPVPGNQVAPANP
jgi:hypothetical protein